LRPEHYLLDVACGSFRAGRFFIEYLLPSHYYGFDGDCELIKQGIKHVLKPAGLLAKKPVIHCIKLTPEPLDFMKLFKRKFDYIWIHALFDHIPPDVVRATLIGLSKVLASTGYIYATIFLNPDPSYTGSILHLRDGSIEGAVVSYPDREYYHYTLEFFKAIDCLVIESCIDNYPHPLGLKMLKLKLAEGKG